MFGKFGLAALSAALVLGLAATAEAAPKRKKMKAVSASQSVSVNGYPAGMFRVSRGDPLARSRDLYPHDPNPPSLRGQYDLRSRLLHEQRR